jgi:hypothetical protein
MASSIIAFENFHYSKGGALGKMPSTGILRVYFLNWGRLVKVEYNFGNKTVNSMAFGGIIETISSKQLETSSVILMENKLGNICFAIPTKMACEYSVVNFGMSRNVLEGIMRRHFDVMCGRENVWKVFAEIGRMKSGVVNLDVQCK